MLVENILITGSKGVIGKVLVEGLSPSFNVTQADLPEVDLQDFSQVCEVMKGQDAVVHLAWSKKRIINGQEVDVDDANRELIDPMNLEMALNIYRAAEEYRVRRVVMASSGQADDFLTWKGPDLMQPYTLPTPIVPYGANKVWIETVGRIYAKRHGLEVVCIRFGAVRTDNLPPEGENHIFLNHRDCIEAVKASLVVPSIPKNYTIFYAISNNPGRIYDLINPVGWKPENFKELI